MAVNQHDQYSLENVLSPLFLDVAANGDITTRNQQVVQVLNTDDKNLWLSQRVITVRMMGDIAVANGTYTLRHSAGGKPVEEKGVFTHVFERNHGGWVCINSQRTVLRQESRAATSVRSNPRPPSRSTFRSSQSEQRSGTSDQSPLSMAANLRVNLDHLPMPAVLTRLPCALPLAT